MNKYRFRFRIILTTFTLGLVSVWLSNFFNTNEINLSDVRFVTIAPGPPRFTETFRGCGMGYVQGYVTNDNINLTEGNLGCEKPRKHDKRIIQSNNEKIISKIETKEKTYYQIYQLRNSHCINAPTLELALELEKWLKSQE